MYRVNERISSFYRENEDPKKEIEKMRTICSQLDAVIDNSYDGIYITDGNANTILVNKSYEEITGIKVKNVIGRNMRDIVKDGIISESGTLLVLEKKKSVTIEQTFNNGKTVLISSNPVIDEEGNISMVVTNVRDITKLNELTEKLTRSEEISKRYYSEIESIKSQALRYSQIIAEDKQMLEVLKKAKKIAPMDLTVLLLGESGVGKEVIARYIYENSRRQDKYFLKVNCGAIPENLIESQLFGYEKGSFSGADKNGKMGIFETANGGTVFLDEVGELSLDMQVKFLRVLQENEIIRVGGTKSIKVDIRIVAATNRNLENLVKRKLFREDLYYRLNVVPVTIPPLRERKKDIPILIEHFLNELNLKLGFNKKIDQDVVKILVKYKWPGNIRELRNMIARLVVVSNSDIITVRDLPVDLDLSLTMPHVEFPTENINLDKLIKQYEKNIMDRAYEKFNNVRDAAKYLGMHPSTFVRKRQRYERS
ncbi:sigma 54-interacting transcriptional regulator [Clostridium sp. D2Q-14]|uniref:sigma-54 interaction domain-containing protein n=1 Tax=Anaeromonas gelatinilytica TaxID=2683194 RepID=UPI00193B3506|nr:sigma 54-interacting transcriptional regulator [Anaeromonas gelatinilytica]MBS4536745.1 sigma 54-interacting transcriptional regulator [Anaeromonas gelatinilytica]